MKKRRSIQMNKRKSSVFDGLLADNTVLSSLMVISPVIVCGDSLRNACALMYAFSAITFLSVMAASFVPRKLPYTIKIIIYALISSLVYIPVKLAAEQFYPDAIPRIGIYFPLLAVNSLIVFQTEAKFFRMKKLRMIPTLIFYILGFDIVMAVTAFIRELFAYGTINSRIVDVNTVAGGLAQPFGGFIFLGLMCGAYRAVRFLIMNAKNESGGESDVSDN